MEIFHWLVKSCLVGGENSWLTAEDQQQELMAAET